MSPTTRKYLKVDHLASSLSGSAASASAASTAHSRKPATATSSSSTAQSAYGQSHPVAGSLHPRPGPGLSKSQGPSTAPSLAATARLHHQPASTGPLAHSSSTAHHAGTFGMGPPPLRTTSRAAAAVEPTTSHARTVSGSSSVSSSRSASRSDTRDRDRDLQPSGGPSTGALASSASGHSASTARARGADYAGPGTGAGAAAGPQAGRSGFKPTASHAGKPIAGSGTASRPAARTLMTSSTGSVATLGGEAGAHGPATITTTEHRKARRVPLPATASSSSISSLAPPAPPASTAASSAASAGTLARSHSSTSSLAKSHGPSTATLQQSQSSAKDSVAAPPSATPATSSVPAKATAAPPQSSASTQPPSATAPAPAIAASGAHAPFRPTRRPQAAGTTAPTTASASTSSTASTALRARPGVAPSAATLASRERRAARERERERKAAEAAAAAASAAAKTMGTKAAGARSREREEVVEAARGVPLPPPGRDEEEGVAAPDAGVTTTTEAATTTLPKESEDYGVGPAAFPAASPMAETVEVMEPEENEQEEGALAAVAVPAELEEPDEAAPRPAPEEDATEPNAAVSAAPIPDQPTGPVAEEADVSRETETAEVHVPPLEAPVAAPVEAEHPTFSSDPTVDAELAPPPFSTSTDHFDVEESVGMDSDYLVESQGTETGEAGDETVQALEPQEVATVFAVEPEQPAPDVAADARAASPSLDTEGDDEAATETTIQQPESEVREPQHEVAAEENQSSEADPQVERDVSGDAPVSDSVAVEAAADEPPAAEDALASEETVMDDRLVEDESSAEEGRAETYDAQQGDAEPDLDEPVVAEVAEAAADEDENEDNASDAQAQLSYGSLLPSPLLAPTVKATNAPLPPSPRPSAPASPLKTPSRSPAGFSRKPSSFATPSPGPFSRDETPFTPVSSVPVRFPAANMPYSPEPFQTRSIILDTPPRFESFAPIRLPRRSTLSGKSVESREEADPEEDEASPGAEDVSTDISASQAEGLSPRPYAETDASRAGQEANAVDDEDDQAGPEETPAAPAQFFPDEGYGDADETDSTFDRSLSVPVEGTAASTRMSRSAGDEADAFAAAVASAEEEEEDEPAIDPPQPLDTAAAAAPSPMSTAAEGAIWDGSEDADDVARDEADTTVQEKSEASTLTELVSPSSARAVARPVALGVEADSDEEEQEMCRGAPASPAGTTLDFSDFNAIPSSSTPSAPGRRAFWDQSLLGDESANFELEQPGLRFSDETHLENSINSTVLGDFDISGRGPTRVAAAFARASSPIEAAEEEPPVLQRSLRSRVVAVDLASSTTKTPARTTRSTVASARRDALAEVQP